MPPISGTACVREQFTRDQWRSIERLRLRYQRAHDFWSERELAHLRFLRWLVLTGRLVS
jgi:hypothetical protein